MSVLVHVGGTGSVECEGVTVSGQSPAGLADESRGCCVASRLALRELMASQVPEMKLISGGL